MRVDKWINLKEIHFGVFRGAAAPPLHLQTATPVLPLLLPLLSGGSSSSSSCSSSSILHLCCRDVPHHASLSTTPFSSSNTIPNSISRKVSHPVGTDSYISTWCQHVRDDMSIQQCRYPLQYGLGAMPAWHCLPCHLDPFFGHEKRRHTQLRLLFV